MDRKPGLSRVICLRRQPGIGQSLFMLRSMGSDASPFKHQRRPAQSTQTAGEPPSYSPDLNPIEQLFAKLKSLLRKAAARTQNALWETIGTLLDDFPHAECQNYIVNSGYEFV